MDDERLGTGTARDQEVTAHLSLSTPGTGTPPVPGEGQGPSAGPAAAAPVGAVELRESKVPALLVGVSCYFFLTGVFQSLVSIRGNELHLGGVTLGLAVAFGSGAVGTLTDIPLAVLADARGVPRMVRIGLIFSVGASALLLAPGRAVLFAGAFAFGLASSAMGCSLLGWLTVATPGPDQARVQGLNGSLQRGGALVASGLVGLALLLKRPSLLAATAVVVALIAVRALNGPAQWLAGARGAKTHLTLGGVPRLVTTSFALFGSYRIRMAAITSIAINAIFLATNAYLPLVHGRHSALIVTLSLVARDVVAVLVGLVLTFSRAQVARTGLVALCLVVSGLSTWLSGELLGTAWPILFSGLQGAVIALFIAATNLFTVGGSSQANRTVGMAVGLWPTRLLLLVLPIVGSVVLRNYGLADVFRFMALILALLAVYATIATLRHWGPAAT
jgi:hypothetical protein